MSWPWIIASGAGAIIALAVVFIIGCAVGAAFAGDWYALRDRRRP